MTLAPLSSGRARSLFSSRTMPSAASSWAIARAASFACSGVSCSAVAEPWAPGRRLFRLAAMKVLMAENI